ncbi:NADH-quinone oxidoreductase subunit M [Chlamydiales bacterium STE3]|nr:NADH-quinone oxidoreductase subunit M [Chlamydiales bacterium STE3]
MPYLMGLFLLPFFAVGAVLISRGISSKQLQWLALLLSLMPLAFLIGCHPHWIGSSVQHDWMPFLSIQFYLRIDSLSLLFLYLTAIIIPISILAIHPDQLESAHYFYALVLFLQGLLIGFFTARDLVFFVIFWEAMLLPLYFIINGWGGEKRQAASLKFLVYLIAGSCLMVVGLLALYSAAPIATFDLDQLAHSSATHSVWIFAIFALAFAVKTPLFPFHGWLPDAYYEAPTAGTILLSALLSKAGIYGFLRVGVGLFPELMMEWSSLFLGLAIVGVFYGGFAAWGQTDYKRLLAYSSFSHVNFILAGVFAWSQIAHSGAILQAFNHGITITALFLVAGWLSERIKTTSMETTSGLAQYLPSLCWLTFFFVLSAIALPGLNNFVGEIMILWGLFIPNPWMASILAATVILSALYMLRWMQKMYFGRPSGSGHLLQDISKKEFAIAFPLIILILWIGIYPAPFIESIKQTNEKMALAITEESK